MKKYRLLILKILLGVVLVFALLYSVFLFVLPSVFSSSYFYNKLNQIVYSKSGIKTDAEKFRVQTYPNLLIRIGADKLFLADKEGIELLTAKDAYILFDLKKFAAEKLHIKYIFINEKGFKNLVKNNKNKKTSDFRFKQFPEADVEKAEVWIDKGGIDSIFVILSNLHIVNQSDDKTYCSFEAEIISTLLRNLITIGKTGYLYIDDNALYANNLQILVGVSELTADGKLTDDNKKSDFILKGNDIPISDAAASLLYFQKLKNPSKKFIENFYDFSGMLDVDVSVRDGDLYGVCNAKKLAAKTLLFDVPVFFNSVDFNLNKRNISASSDGLLGGGKVYTSFDISDIASENQKVKGIVRTRLSNSVAHKYIPDITIDGNADISVNYSVENKKIFVDYLLKLKEGSDLHYKDAYLGLKDKNRRMLVNTLKENDSLYINHYDYSYQNGSVIDNIILGDGLLVKQNGHFRLDYITCKTNGYAPVSVTGSFGKYVKEGFFKGDLKYNSPKNIITGLFIVKDTNYRNFFVREAKVNADEKVMKIEAEGKYDGSAFNCELEAENNFTDKINIHNMYLFLDEYIVSARKNSSFNAVSAANIAEQTQDIDMNIDKWTIKLNKIKRNNLEFLDILVTGSLKDDIFSFTVPHIKFAQGTIRGAGLYNIRDNSADILISANNINSDIAAGDIFNLSGEISGRADASLHAYTNNKFEDINGNINFAVKDGYLPKLGSTEFMIKTSRRKEPLKFKLSNIVNVDIKNMKALSSDINGKFDFNNEIISDAKITSAQKYLAILIEGDYDADNQSGNLNLFGKYNNKQISRVKIFFVPLSWLVKLIFRPEETMHLYKDKLDEVPSITALPNEESAFRVKLEGNLNKNDLTVELKSIK